MPPVKRPPQPKNDAMGIFILTVQNLEEMIRVDRRSSHPGHDVGHIVQRQLDLTAVVVALTLAIEGKRWEPPQ